MKQNTYTKIDANASTDSFYGRSYPAEAPSQYKKHRVIAIVVFLILILAAVAVTLTVVLLKKDVVEGDRFSFEDIFDSKMKVQRKGVRWVDPDGSLTYKLNGDIYVQTLPNENAEVYIKGSDILDEQGNPLDFFDYWFSADQQYLLLGTQYEKVWRHSYTGIYYLYEIETKELTLISSSRIQYAVFSTVGHNVAYVTGNNVYVLLETGESLTVTNDGSLNIINGIPAWVYEEEILSSPSALWWSPDGAKISFLKSDETQVGIFYLTKYGKGAYPENIPVKYPKPGYENPTANVYIFDIGTREANLVDLRQTDEFLIVDVAWFSESILAARVTNREQNVSELFQIDANSLIAKIVSKQTPAQGWVEYSALFPVKGTNRYIELIDYNGYNHIAMYDLSQIEPISMLTSGNWEVTSIVGYLPQASKIFYMSTEAGETERHLYQLDINTGARVKLTEEPGFYSVSFSTQSGFYLVNYNGPDIPNQRLKSSTDSNVNILLENNDALRETLSTYDLPEKRFIKVQLPPNGEWTQPYEINCMMMLPPDFKESSTYPLLMRVYGGPGSNLVQQTFGLDWHTYLTSSENYIVTMCDGRGTGQTGNVLKKSVYKHLGEYEANDQVEAGRYFGSLKYVDSSNMAIWGWSYGGYMTSKVLETGSQVYIAGIAVAPVTDWLYYDTVYTERYMITPQENPDGYEKSAVRNYANINGTEFLIVHGTADDNVHFQHATVLASDLTNAGVDFSIHIYTDNDHSINTGANTQPDLYRRFTNFLLALQEK